MFDSISSIIDVRTVGYFVIFTLVGELSTTVAKYVDKKIANNTVNIGWIILHSISGTLARIIPTLSDRYTRDKKLNK